MTGIVEEDLALDPQDIGLLCVVGIVLEADGIGDLFQQCFGAVGHDLCLLDAEKTGEYSLTYGINQTKNRV